MQKLLGIAYQSDPMRPDPERQFRYAVAAGFCETELSFESTLTEELFRAAHRARLTVGAIRLPTEGVNLLWEAPREDGEEAWDILYEIYASCIAFAARAEIRTVIAVPSVGDNPPPISQCGIDRFRALSALAKEKGVQLVIENTESAPHFETAVRAVCDGFHGVAFHPALAARFFGSSAVPEYALPYLCRLSLADTRGDTADALPFEGECDYAPFFSSLSARYYNGPLVLTVSHTAAPYSEMDYPTYASRAYDALCAFMRRLKDAEGVI